MVVLVLVDMEFFNVIKALALIIKRNERMLRTVEQWKEILDELTPKEAAKRILGDITHYYEGRSHELSDREQLANALLAYASLGIPPKDTSCS